MCELALPCQVAGCGFETPRLPDQFYAAMVDQLKVHHATVHGGAGAEASTEPEPRPGLAGTRPGRRGASKGPPKVGGVRKGGVALKVKAEGDGSAMEKDDAKVEVDCEKKRPRKRKLGPNQEVEVSNEKKPKVKQGERGKNFGRKKGLSKHAEQTCAGGDAEGKVAGAGTGSLRSPVVALRRLPCTAGHLGPRHTAAQPTKHTSPGSTHDKGASGNSSKAGQKFKCANCSDTFGSPGWLTIHRRKVHSKEGQVAAIFCQNCGKTFMSRRSLFRHKNGCTGKSVRKNKEKKQEKSEQVNTKHGTEVKVMRLSEESKPDVDEVVSEDIKAKVESEDKSEGVIVNTARPAAGAERLQCRTCSRTYSRADSLRRHRMLYCRRLMEPHKMMTKELTNDEVEGDANEVQQSVDDANIDEKELVSEAVEKEIGGEEYEVEDKEVDDEEGTSEDEVYGDDSSDGEELEEGHVKFTVDLVTEKEKGKIRLDRSRVVLPKETPMRLLVQKLARQFGRRREEVRLEALRVFRVGSRRRWVEGADLAAMYHGCLLTTTVSSHT